MTTETRRPLPMASSGCACRTPATFGEATASAATAASSAEAATYRVEGMTCGHCAKSVIEELTALDGVDEVHVDLVAGGTSTVTLTGSVAPAAVRAAVEEAGYTLVTD